MDNTNTVFIVMDSSAAMPLSCYGQYRRVAVVEVSTDQHGEPARPRMISKRAKGIVRIVETWERLNVGKTDRCAYQRGLAKAHAVAAEMNGAGCL